MRSGLEWLMAVEKNGGRSHYFGIGRGPELCRCLIAPIPQSFGKSLLSTVAPDHFRRNNSGYQSSPRAPETMRQ